MNGTENPGPIIHVVVAGEVGGAERMVLALARAAATLRPSPQRRHLIALWTDAPAVAALFAGGGVEVLRAPRPIGASHFLHGATGGPDVGWLSDQLRACRASAVQLHTFASHVLGTRAGLRAGVPVIRTEHSTRVYDNWLCRPFSMWSLRRAAVVVTVSDYLRRQIAARAPAVAARAQVIHNGVPCSDAAAAPTLVAPEHGDTRLALVARLEPRKGVDRALAALARAQVPTSVSLDIVGDGPARAALERQARSLGVAPRVRFWGYRRDPETIVAQCHALLCSSRTEGMGVALVEGMSLGRPVVAVPVGGVPEIVCDGDNGWLASESSVPALASVLAAVARAGRVEIARRGARARTIVKARFTEARMAAAYEALYQSLESARITTEPAYLRRTG